MKSREYLNTFNGLVYWLEDDAVMMRKREGTKVMRSTMTAAIFFEMVGNDTLILVESEPEQKSMTMNEFSNFLAGIDKSTTTATAQTAIQGGPPTLPSTVTATSSHSRCARATACRKMMTQRITWASGFADRSSTATLREQSASWVTLAASIATGGNSASRSHSNSTFC
jgi:hypothetical protein